MQISNSAMNLQSWKQTHDPSFSKCCHASRLYAHPTTPINNKILKDQMDTTIFPRHHDGVANITRINTIRGQMQQTFV
jgi:hypothetical protein